MADAQTTISASAAPAGSTARKATWRHLLTWRPATALRLLSPAGARIVWAAEPGAELPAGLPPKHARFVGVEIPDDLVLRRQLRLPAGLSDADVLGAVALEAASASPFAESDLTWGWARGAAGADGLGIEVVLASRAQVEGYIDSMRAQRADLGEPEAWAAPGAHGLVMLQGFGESTRLRRGGRALAVAAVLALVAVMLGGAVAVSPTLQLRLVALDAVYTYETLHIRTRGDVQLRESVLRTNEKITALGELAEGTIEPLALVEFLTRVLPDDTFLTNIRAQGRNVVISGQTPNTANLMKALSVDPAIREVRAPGAATRIPNTGRELFTVEMTLRGTATDALAATVVAQTTGTVATATSPTTATTASPTPTLAPPAGAASAAPAPRASASASAPGGIR